MADESTKRSGRNTVSSPSIVDMLLSRKEDSIVVDSDTLIKNVQERIYNALENGYQYTKIVDASDAFLRKNMFGHVGMAVLYVDLVGSTKMSLSIPSNKLSTVISSFAQEMAYVITEHRGYVLKFVGDAVIGYFVSDETNALQAADNAVACGESMIKVVKNGINPILVNKADLPQQLEVKVGIDYGENTVVRYGADEKRAFVDLLGPSMNMAAKIQDLAKPNQIVVGRDIYDRLHPKVQGFFVDITEEMPEWNYTSKSSDEIYPVFVYRQKTEDKEDEHSIQ